MRLSFFFYHDTGDDSIQCQAEIEATVDRDGDICDLPTECPACDTAYTARDRSDLSAYAMENAVERRAGLIDAAADLRYQQFVEEGR